MTLDAHANLPSTFVAKPPSPADTGTVLAVSPGDGAIMPAVDPFNCTVWSAGVQANRTNSEIIRMTCKARTTIASGSNGVTLPQATIHVADSTGFSGTDSGTCAIVTTDGQIQIIAFTGTGSGTLTGCTGGTGTMHTSDKVVSDAFNIVRTTEGGENGIKIARSILKGDQIEATITKKTLTDIEGLVAGTISITDGSTTVADLTEITFPSGSVTDEGGGNASVALDPLTVGDGATSLSDVKSIVFAGAAVSSGGTGVADVTVDGGGSVSVTDGVTEVDDIAQILFVGATVVDDGSGIAEVDISATPPFQLTLQFTFGGGLYSPIVSRGFPGGLSTEGLPPLTDFWTSIALTVGSSTPVVDLTEVDIGFIPDDTDTYNLQATVLVANLDGTQILQIDANATTTPGDTEVQILWPGATVTTIAGTDLTWDEDAGEIASTAGGTYFVTIIINAFWS